MKIVIPLYREDQSIPKQYTRQLNNRPVYTYILNTVKNFLEIHTVEVWTDILEVYNRLKSERGITPVLFERKQDTLEERATDEFVFFVNPDLPFLSFSTLKAILQGDKDKPCLYVTNCGEWLGFYGPVSSFFCKEKFFQEEPVVLNVSGVECINIRTKQGWWIAEKETQKKRIIIHPKSSSKIGMGHVYRGLTLASKLYLDHDVLFVFSAEQEIGIELVSREGYDVKTYHNSALPVMKQFQPDIVINDLLNTTKEYMLELRKLNCRIVNFEDLGEGAELADAVINALYPGDVPRKNFYTGQNYYCIREDFIGIPKKEVTEEVKEILLTYGGSDPQNITLKTIKSLLDIQPTYGFKIRAILGPAYQHHEELYSYIESIDHQHVEVHEVVTDMAHYLKNADLIFTSAGRTMYEIATIATPAIVVAQNYRELTHTFGHPYNGFYNLGFWAELSESDYQKAAEDLINNYEMRKLMNQRMCNIDLTKGIDRVMRIILGKGEAE